MISSDCPCCGQHSGHDIDDFEYMEKTTCKNCGETIMMEYDCDLEPDGGYADTKYFVESDKCETGK